MRSSRDDGGARSLKTAAVVLRALRLLGTHPDGLTAADLGRHLGKSAATARYLINTLCEAGYAERDPSGGVCRLRSAPPWGVWAADGTSDEPAGSSQTPAQPGGSGGQAQVDLADPNPRTVLAEALTELYRSTRQRAYLVRRSASLVATIVDTRGHQGLARLPGLGPHIPPDAAHALALTKVLLAVSPSYLEAVVSEQLTVHTPGTISSVSALRQELAEIRRRGYAVDSEEYAAGFCGIAAPIPAPSGTATLALGLSTSARRFALEGPQLVEIVTRVAASAAEQWVRCAHQGPPPLAVVSAPRR